LGGFPDVSHKQFASPISKYSLADHLLPELQFSNMDSASGSTSDNPLDNLPPALAQVIQLALSEFIKGNLPSIYIMIIASLWLGISLCLLMALLWSSRPEKRKTPLFISCVVAVGFGTVP
jgi:hypothetical protein